MLDNAAGEILRNLRMVISTLRLDIDQIVLCDALAKLPNIAAYCRQVGLTAPMENVMNLFSGGSVPPVTTQSAQQRGYDAVSFITFNGLLTMPLQEANLLQGESNILSAIAKDGSSKIGNLAAGVLGVLAAVWIIGISGWWIAMEVRKNGDQSALANKEFPKAEQLIKDEETWTTRKNNLTKDLETLPQTANKSSVIVNQIYQEVIRKSDGFENLTITNESTAGVYTSKVSITFNTKQYKDFVNMKNSINETGFFKVGESLSSDRVSKASATNSQTYYKNTVSLSLTDLGLEKSALTEEDKAKREKANTTPTTTTDPTKTNPETTTDPDKKPENSGSSSTTVPSDATVDEKLVGEWEATLDLGGGMTMTMGLKFNSDGTGVASTNGQGIDIKYGTKDGKLYMAGAEGNTSVNGDGKYSIDGDTLTYEMNGQKLDLKKK